MTEVQTSALNLLNYVILENVVYSKVWVGRVACEPQNQYGGRNRTPRQASVTYNPAHIHSGCRTRSQLC